MVRMSSRVRMALTPRMINPHDATLRPATPEDYFFSYEVKKAALRAYVEPIWGWDEAVQIEFHRKTWHARQPDIIRLADRDIGTVQLLPHADHLHLVEFYLLPEFQRHGIGAHLMTRLVASADAQRLPIRLEVIKNNPAKSLYLRFGFNVTTETATHYKMTREAGPPPL